MYRISSEVNQLQASQFARTAVSICGMWRGNASVRSGGARPSIDPVSTAPSETQQNDHVSRVRVSRASYRIVLLLGLAPAARPAPASIYFAFEQEDGSEAVAQASAIAIAHRSARGAQRVPRRDVTAAHPIAGPGTARRSSGAGWAGRGRGRKRQSMSRTPQITA